MNVDLYFRWQGFPNGEPDCSETVTHPKNESTKTFSSLPPMVMVTRRVLLVRAFSWGGTPCAWEVKKSAVGARTKIPHLSYIGDAEIGENTNIAAGNITANFKHEAGQPKATTRIGSNVRTGVDNTFDAPVEVGDDAWLAPGAVITEDVPPGSLAGFAPRQVTKKGWVYEKHGNRDDD